MNHIKTFEGFLNESKKNITQLATELVEIASSYTDVDLTPSMSQAQRIDNEDKLYDFYSELLDYMVEEDVDPKEIAKFQKDADSFLKKHGIKP